MRISDWSSDVCSSDLTRVDLTRLHLQVLIGGRFRIASFPLLLRLALAGCGAEAGVADGAADKFGLFRLRSEERRVGHECVSQGRCGWWTYNSRKKLTD